MLHALIKNVCNTNQMFYVASQTKIKGERADHQKQLVYVTCVDQECLQYKQNVLCGLTDKNPKD
jgi:hypothetical protein